MKATGIVRRIDDLGRVVIPKEIRRTMRIREGDPLEIYTNAGGEVIFKKYSPVGELSSFSSEYAEALTAGTKLGVIICDKERCIASGGISKRETADKRVTSALEQIMENRKTVCLENDMNVPALEGVDRRICAAVPIIAAGDVTGAVVLLETPQAQTARENDVNLAEVAAGFLAKQME